jgi:hypothetical protein
MTTYEGQCPECQQWVRIRPMGRTSQPDSTFVTTFLIEHAPADCPGLAKRPHWELDVWRTARLKQGP